MAKNYKHYSLAVMVALAFVLGLGTAYVMAAPGTTTATIEYPADVATGTLPGCVDFTGHGNTTNNVVATLPFIPTHVVFHPNHTSTDGSGVWLEWSPNFSTAGHLNHSLNGTTVHVSASAISASGNVLTIPVPRASATDFWGRACRW